MLTVELAQPIAEISLTVSAREEQEQELTWVLSAGLELAREEWLQEPLEQK
jgi:hypothetical protein